MHIIEKISCIRVSSRRNIIIKKNVCTEYEEHFPFGVFRQIIRDILIEREHDAGYGSDSSLSTDGLDDGLTHNTSDTLHLESLQDLCAELNYSEELVNSVAENMLGLKPSGSSFKDEEKKLEPVDAVDLVSDIFLKCMSGNNFVFLALDDTQWMDSLSWKVVERIMDLGVNFMIICLSRPLTRNRDEGFLTTLQEEVKNSHHPRFFCLSLLPFSKNDVKNLLGAAFECDPSKIEENICDHLYETTGGMPYFTQEIISNLIKKDLIELKKSGSIGWRSELSKEVNIYSNVNDLLLHRLDDFKSEGRSLLQLCAVLGFEFSLSELLSVQCRGRRRKPKQVKEIQGILNRAVNERILLEISQGGSSYKRKGDNLSSQILRSEENEVCEKFYTFTHSIWLNCVLGTMLEDWKRDLHKTVASVLEIQGYGDLKDLKSANRLFGHWKYANNLMKAGELALKLGTYFHSLLLIREASDVCLEAIQMWKDVYPIKKEGVDIAGMSKTLIDSIAPDEIDLLARLHVAVARMGDGKETRIFYRKAYIILTQSPSAANMKDRRVFFAVISGLFVCVKNGLCEDRGLSVESLAKTFVEQAEIHGDPVHIARALSMESLAFASLGKFEDAIASQKKLEKIYSADELSKGIILEYASDRAAQNYGYSVTWYELLGHYEECDRQIKYILEEIMPMMPIQNVHNSLIILCPILWVLMDKQKSQEAETIFVTYVYDRFYEVYGKNSTTYYFSMYKPLRTLFLLAGEDEDRQKEEKYTSKQNYQSIENWVFSDRFDSIKEYISITMRPYGKDPHSILAEICYYLAVVQGQDKTRQKKLLHKGFELAQRSISKTKDDPGIECAYHRGKKILKKIQNVVGNLPHDNERDIGSIHARLELEHELISLEDISVFVNRVVKTSKDKFQSHDKTYSAGMFMATNIQSWEMLGQNERGLMYAIVDRHVMIDQVVALLEHRLSLALDAQVRKPRLSCEAKAELRAYVTCIESLYNQVEYHSFQHIVHAIISMNKLIEMVVNSQLIRESIIEEEVYYTHFLMIFSVLIHDVAHTGMSNKILLDQNHAFVGKYGCVSTAETLSIDLSINILFHNEFSKIKCAILPTIHHKIKFGKVIFSSILCTDIASSDRMKMCKMRFDTLKDTLDNSQHDMQPKKEVCGPQLCKLVSFKENFHKFSFLSDEELETYHSELVCTQETLKSMVLTESLMQTADIAHTMQDWKNFLKWNYRLYKELMNCHRQGFMHNPSQHWSQGEIGFFEGYVIPLATRTEFCFRNAPLKLVKLANNNLRRWRIQGDAVTKLFILGVENQEAEEDVLRKCFSLSHSVGDLN
uniref:Phosphodiesterase n=1 Tax=Corethron hystrix TaxID=216773 RepID=A0A7S1BMB6_9STRA